MAKFDVNIPVRTADGGTREITGTVSNRSPLYAHDKARCDAATQAQTQLGPGESIDAGAITVCYSHTQ
jgi:hypothetical protein